MKFPHKIFHVHLCLQAVSEELVDAVSPVSEELAVVAVSTVSEELGVAAVLPFSEELAVAAAVVRPLDEGPTRRKVSWP